jgi:hypothetical protein
MSNKRYEFLTTLCLLGAVASAFAFDKADHLQWLVGAFGIASAVTSIGIYFYNL